MISQIDTFEPLIFKFRGIANNWIEAIRFVDSVAERPEALSGASESGVADFAWNAFKGILDEGKNQLRVKAKLSLDREADRLFRPLIRDLEIPARPFKDPLEYAESIIRELPTLKEKSLIQAADLLFRFFHPDGYCCNSFKQTSTGVLFSFPAGYDEISKQSSYGTHERTMEKANGLWIVHEKLCPKQSFDLSMLNSAFQTRHDEGFKRQTVPVSTFAMVTIFKSAVKFELSMEAMEALQLIWAEFGSSFRHNA